MPDTHPAPVAYKAVLLAAVLLVLGLLFRQLATLMLAVLMTIIIAIPLSAGATRLQRHGVPRPVGALLTLLAGLAVVAGILALIIPTFIDQTNEFVDDVPGIVHDLEVTIGDITGDRPSEVGNDIQDFLRGYTDDPERLIGPITAIGLGLAGVFAALVVILITAYYMAVRPQPLVDGALRLVPPARRRHARVVMDRLRGAWIGWMQGVAFDMFISGTLLYIGLSIIGLDFAILFAVLTALLVVVPYFGAIVGAIPPVLFALTDSPGKALAVLAVYILVQQIEGNIIIPVVMSRTTRLHPALIAIGVVVVGQLFGVVGLFVAVPIISAAVILTEEIYVREIEAAHENRATVDIALAGPEEPLPRGAPPPSPAAPTPPTSAEGDAVELKPRI
ncbi:MAG: AI-2E family transporter [Solirubrobacterales bacterium]